MLHSTLSTPIMCYVMAICKPVCTLKCSDHYCVSWIHSKSFLAIFCCSNVCHAYFLLLLFVIQWPLENAKLQ